MTVQKSRLLSSEGVASKRNFFEGSAPSKAEPAALRKVRWGCSEWGHPRLGGHPLWGKCPLLGHQLGSVGARAEFGHRGSASSCRELGFEELGWSQGVGWAQSPCPRDWAG